MSLELGQLLIGLHQTLIIPIPFDYIRKVNQGLKTDLLIL